MIFTWLRLPNNNSIILADSFREGFMDERIENIGIVCQELGKLNFFLKNQRFSIKKFKKNNYFTFGKPGISISSLNILSLSKYFILNLFFGSILLTV